MDPKYWTSLVRPLVEPMRRTSEKSMCTFLIRNFCWPCAAVHIVDWAFVSPCPLQPPWQVQDANSLYDFFDITCFLQNLHKICLKKSTSTFQEIHHVFHKNQLLGKRSPRLASPPWRGLGLRGGPASNQSSVHRSSILNLRGRYLHALNTWNAWTPERSPKKVSMESSKTALNILRCLIEEKSKKSFFF